ncbi:MAG: hypothetical protein ABR577_14280 [Pyrinomonadaceae bacterium]
MKKIQKFTRSFCLLLFAASFCLLLAGREARAQEVVDETIATVNGGVSTELITYTDLIWQMALQPATSLANPRLEDLNNALHLVIDQRLILQEAGRLPTIAPAAKDVDAALAELIKQFPSSAEFEQRARRVGLSSEQLREIVRQRLAIENYLDFRFRSFTNVTDAEIAAYYRDVYVPRFRQQAPSRIVPMLEQVREQISRTLTESKIESETDAFLDTARERAEIVCLDTAYRCADQ